MQREMSQTGWDDGTIYATHVRRRVLVSQGRSTNTRAVTGAVGTLRRRRATRSRLSSQESRERATTATAALLHAAHDRCCCISPRAVKSFLRRQCTRTPQAED